MKEQLDRNWRVVKSQWRDYRRELIYLNVRLWDSIRQGRLFPWQDDSAGHIVQGYVEEFFDKMPRISSYLFWPTLGAFLWLAFT